MINIQTHLVLTMKSLDFFKEKLKRKVSKVDAESAKIAKIKTQRALRLLCVLCVEIVVKPYEVIDILNLKFI